MTLLANIVERLQSKIPQIRQIDIVANMDEAYEEARAWPHIFVFAPEYYAESNDRMTLFMDQRVTVNFNVAIGVNNVRGIRGRGSLEEAEQYRPMVFSALHNWIPLENYNPIEYSGGGLIMMHKGHFVHGDRFTTSYHLRSDTNV